MNKSHANSLVTTLFFLVASIHVDQTVFTHRNLASMQLRLLISIICTSLICPHGLGSTFLRGAGMDTYILGLQEKKLIYEGPTLLNC